MKFLVAVLLASMLLCGCVRYQPRPLSAAQTAAELEARSLTNAALRGFMESHLGHSLPSWPPVAWNLDLLTLAAFYYQPSLEVARAHWRETQGGILTAKARPNPVLSATPGYDNQVPGNPTPWMAMVSLDVPIETMGKRRRRAEQAGYLSESARLDIISTAWQVRAAVRSSLLDFAAAKQRAELLEGQEALQREAIDRMEQQLQAGAVATAEVTAARVALARSSADLADARRQLADARARVAEAVGVPVRAFAGMVLDFDIAAQPMVEDLTSAGARRAALQSRADVRGALADYAASQSALQLEIARQYPDFHLNPGYGYNQGNAGDNQGLLGVSVELPVFNHNQGPIAEAEARRAESAARVVSLQAKILGELDRAILNFETSRSNVVALEFLAAEQEKLQRSLLFQFQAGAANRLEVLGAEIDVAAAKLGALDAETKLHQAVGALEDAVQQPMELPAAEAFGKAAEMSTQLKNHR